MPTSQITGSVTSGVVLTSGAFYDPVTVTGTGTVTNSGYGKGIYAGTLWTVINYGNVQGGPDSGATAIWFQNGGYLTNETTGSVSGATNGVVAISGAATVDNSGNIAGYNAIYLYSGGSVTNESTGTISGGAGSYAHGIFVRNDPGTLTNFGSISGNSGVWLNAGGSLSNQSSATIYGAVNGFVVLGGAGTVDNQGSIGSGNTGIYLNNGGSVTNEATGTISGDSKAIRSNDVATIDNAGAISSGNTGIYLDNGGSVTNESTGTISAHSIGIVSSNAPLIVANSGYIYAKGAAAISASYASTLLNSGAIVSGRNGAIRFNGGGYISNASTGTIAGNAFGISGKNDSTVVNAGRITGINDGVDLSSGGSLTNLAGGYIMGGGNGVDIQSGVATLENAGTIAASAGFHHYAVKLASGDTLIVDPGAVFGGYVKAQGTGDTLELKAGATAGTINGLGASYSNFYGFQTVTIDSGASWDIAGTGAGLSASTFAGFHAGDRLDITDLGFNAAYTTSFDSASYVLSIIGSDGTTVLDSVQMSGSYAGHTFTLADDQSGGTYVEEDGVACYLRGTRVMTGEGPVAVEHLKIGDLLVTPEGLKPLKWIGRRAYAGWLAFGNPEIQPIRFKAGSLADNVPCRDLLVSPEHAMLIDGVLIPARHLVNGTSIVKAEAMDEIQYFHLELERHSVIFAEDAASETFVDDDSRGMFNNANEFRKLYPDAPVAEAQYCAPRVEDGYRLEAVRRVLGARAARLSPEGTAAASLLQGYLDSVSLTSVEGWAYDPAAPDQPVMLAIIANGAVIGRVLADSHRQGLADAGFGDGCHAFSFALPQGFAPGMAHVIEVRRESDWSNLTDSPMVLETDGADFGSLPPGIGAYRVGIA
jgi:hypothetical protein